MLTEQIQSFYSPWIGAQNKVWESILHLGHKHTYPKGSMILGGGSQLITCITYMQAELSILK
ncbi:hypothetical protein FA11_0436 [Pelosinus fermentans A11]|uniref:Uncharacterized protein n=1 Tax=Pelosinus fermentans B4 TaxID=1149862 RepID=I8RC37_9FIRM|nr:hypothetical protein FB4_0678 [Pelosinus fermentans B4]EIW22853.1 hypothetical protein FA11_0436 [Pelosinus fermentans A11]